MYVISHMFTGIASPISYLHDGFSNIGLGKVELVFLAPSLLLLCVYDYYELKENVISAISAKRTVVRWIIYLAFCIWMIMMLPVVNSAEFIYFQF